MEIRINTAYEFICILIKAAEEPNICQLYPGIVNWASIRLFDFQTCICSDEEAC